MSSSEDDNIKKCEFCPIVFSNIDDLANHLVYGHADNFKIEPENYEEVEPYAENQVQKNQQYNKCEHCGKSFSRANHLKSHIHTVHEGHKDYKCESCGKLFFRAGALKKHIHRLHEGHKDYKCESCGKSFSQSGDLKKHINRIHE